MYSSNFCSPFPGGSSQGPSPRSRVCVSVVEKGNSNTVPRWVLWRAAIMKQEGRAVPWTATRRVWRVAIRSQHLGELKTQVVCPHRTRKARGTRGEAGAGSLTINLKEQTPGLLLRSCSVPITRSDRPPEVLCLNLSLVQPRVCKNEDYHQT